METCEICKAQKTEEFGCECVPLLKRIKALHRALGDLNQHSVADQEFRIAEELRDARRHLVLAMYVIQSEVTTKGE